jgi:pimeloyl-ACP methyl ester carboxylesterase
MTVEFIELDWRGDRVRIEHAWLDAERPDAPLLIFLHEGLGSRSMWRDFPQRLCAASGCRGLVYSRPGYGRSTPRPQGERWGVDFMHRQAYELLPAVRRALAIEQPAWLVGHSDGASIALLHAAQYPDAVAGLVLMAPHLFVEQMSVGSIERTRELFISTDLAQRLARHHADVDSAFWGWNDIWLDPAFRGWNIEAEVARIRCPVLAIQGIDDEYGTMEQIRRIRQHLPSAQLLELADCGHSPHRDQPDQVVAVSVGFIAAASACDQDCAIVSKPP